MKPEQAIAVMIFTAVAMAWDLHSRRIPNWLNLVGLAGALAYHGTRAGWGGLQFSLLGFATGFGILLVLWLIGGGGGGDVKLMGAVGAWLGAIPTLIVFIASGFLSPVLQILMLLCQGTAPQPVPPTESTTSETNTENRTTGNTSPEGQQESSSEAKSGDQAAQAEQARLASHRRKLPYAVPVAIAVWVFCGLKLMNRYFGGN